LRKVRSYPEVNQCERENLSGDFEEKGSPYPGGDESRIFSGYPGAKGRNTPAVGNIAERERGSPTVAAGKVRQGKESASDLRGTDPNGARGSSKKPLSNGKKKL